jgi:hypothetical protein
VGRIRNGYVKAWNLFIIERYKWQLLIYLPKYRVLRHYNDHKTLALKRRVKVKKDFQKIELLVSLPKKKVLIGVA